MGRSSIPYLDTLWSPTSGCSPMSAGCAHCWAAAWHRRFRGGDFSVKLHPEKLDEPLRLRKPSVIGVSFMGDLMHDDVPLNFIETVARVMVEAKRHTFIVLTKRVERMAALGKPLAWLSNVWFGVSVEDQATADERIPVLLDTPAAHRFVSLEPQIGAVDIEPYLPRKSDCDGCGGPNTGGCDFCHPESTVDRDGLDLVIQGCESGAQRRPFDPAWARDCRDACVLAGVPYYYKQGPRADDVGPGVPRVDAHPQIDGLQHRVVPWTVTR